MNRGNITNYGEDNYEHVMKGLIYIESSICGIGCEEELFNTHHKGCECIGNCVYNTCFCLKHFGAPYIYNRLKDNFFKGIFECNDYCTCASSCSTRLLQNGPVKGLVIKKFGEKGFGLCCEQNITKGDFICEYAGEFIGVEEVQLRFSKMQPTDSNFILVMNEYTSDNKQSTIIDPTVVGNIGRYINHSCDPNLQVVPVRTNSMVPHAALFATKNIKAGTELCYDYNGVSNIHTGESNINSTCDNNKLQNNIKTSNCKKCYCEAYNCKGFLPKVNCFK